MKKTILIKTTKILFILLTFLVLLFIGLQFDDELNPEPANAVSILEKQQESVSDSYIYLNGIMASETDNVFNVGKKRLENYKLAEQTLSFIDSSINFDDYPKDKWLQTPNENNPLYCSLKEDGCLADIINGEQKWPIETEFRKTLIDRYNHFLNYSEFTSMITPSSYEQFPEYQYLKYGNRLRLRGCPS